MDWQPVWSALGSALPYVLGFAIVTFVLIIAVAAMTAIWHPDARRRQAAYKVLALVLRALHRRERAGADPSRPDDPARDA